MNTSTPGNAATPGEARFEDRLLTAILDDFGELSRPAAPPRPARRRVMIPALAAGVAAAGIAAAVVLTGGTSGRPATGVASPAGGAPPVHTAAYLVSRMKSALTSRTAVEYILEHAPDSQTGAPVTDESWSTPRSDTYRIVNLSRSGQPTVGYLVTITAHQTVSVTVDYRARTWSRTVYPFGSASDPRRAEPRPATIPDLASQLRAEIKAGTMTLAGRATVDGQQAIHLTESGSTGTVNLWINPVTYLPIREIDTAPGESASSPQAIREDYRWLPATAANLRLITLAGAIPAGFRQVSPDGGH